MEKLLNVDEVAKILRINKQTTLRFIREKKLKAFKAGREYRILEKEIENYLAKC